jgi:hypothetical protein
MQENDWITHPASNRTPFSYLCLCLPVRATSGDSDPEGLILPVAATGLPFTTTGCMMWPQKAVADALHNLLHSQYSTGRYKLTNRTGPAANAPHLSSAKGQECRSWFLESHFWKKLPTDINSQDHPQRDEEHLLNPNSCCRLHDICVKISTLSYCKCLKLNTEAPRTALACHTISSSLCRLPHCHCHWQIGKFKQRSCAHRV